LKKEAILNSLFLEGTSSSSFFLRNIDGILYFIQFSKRKMIVFWMIFTGFISVVGWWIRPETRAMQWRGVTEYVDFNKIWNKSLDVAELRIQ
jgi:hypothetical protein